MLEMSASNSILTSENSRMEQDLLYLFIYLFIYIFIYLYIYLFIYLLLFFYFFYFLNKTNKLSLKPLIRVNKAAAPNKTSGSQNRAVLPK